MITALEIINKYISFFEKKGHQRIPNSPLVPENDPTTLFTSSGMQPLISYLLGQPHPQGKRLVNVQNCFRAADIDEVGDSSHTTFFRMLGNWSLGDYFKKEQIRWFWEFLTKELKLPKEKLYISVFEGFKEIPKDEESYKIWEKILIEENLNPKERIFYYGPHYNWWSRSGVPENMPEGEPGGPDTEIFFDFETEHNPKYGEKCHLNCQCGRFLEIGNSVFMQHQKQENSSFKELPQKNVDFGGGLERLLAAIENKSDIFQTSLFTPIIRIIEQETNQSYQERSQEMRIITDHLVASVFIAATGIMPSNKGQGYILRRLIRRAIDNFYILAGGDIRNIIRAIVNQYLKTDPYLENSFERIQNVIIVEEQTYEKTRRNATNYISKKYKPKLVGDELLGVTEISAEDAFTLYSSHGLSPTQIKSLGFVFDEQKFAEKMEEHQKLSRKTSAGMFKGGLADASEEVTKLHTATHLLHAALRQILGDHVTQKGSNITAERLRFDFSHADKLTNGQLKQVEDLVNEKIKENLPVKSAVMTKDEALKSGALGFFAEKYGDQVTVYTIGPSASSGRPFSIEICGGPHVDFTSKLKSFKIIKQKNLGQNLQRIYAVLEK